MIKKVMIMAIFMLLSLLFINQVGSSASMLTEPPANTGGLWHVEDGNRAYVYMRFADGETVRETGTYTNSEYPDYDYSEYTVWERGSENDFTFPNSASLKSATLNNPDPNIYKTFVVEIIPHIQSIDRFEPAKKTIASYETAVSAITIDLHDWADRPNQNYLYDYSYIDLSVDGNKVLTTRNVSIYEAEALGFEENPNYIDMTFGVRMYWEKETTQPVTDPTDPLAWDSLPETNGNPENPLGDWGTVTNLTKNGQDVAFSINYNGVIYPVSSFTVAGDLAFIDKANDILYYTDPNTGDRVLYFNFGETLSSAILTASSFDNVTNWKGDALWNLTRQEIKVTDVLKVYNYIPEVDADGNVYSYFYMPDVPIDKLISVSSVLAYRYWDDGFLGIGDYEAGDIQFKNVAAVAGEYSNVNPTWVENTYKKAYIASGLVGLATISGVIPGYGWAISGAAFLAGGALQISDVNEFFAYEVSQIQHVIPGVSLATEINTYIADQYAGDQFTAGTDKLYKLHLATLQDSEHVQVLGDLSNVTQVVWQTDGEIYVLNEPDIDNIDYSGPGTTIPVEDPGNSDLETYALYAVVVVIVYIFLNSKFIERLMKNRAFWLMLAAGGIYILYEMGLI